MQTSLMPEKTYLPTGTCESPELEAFARPKTPGSHPWPPLARQNHPPWDQRPSEQRGVTTHAHTHTPTHTQPIGVPSQAATRRPGSPKNPMSSPCKPPPTKIPNPDPGPRYHPPNQLSPMPELTSFQPARTEEAQCPDPNPQDQHGYPTRQPALRAATFTLKSDHRSKLPNRSTSDDR